LMVKLRGSACVTRPRWPPPRQTRRCHGRSGVTDRRLIRLLTRIKSDGLRTCKESSKREVAMMVCIDAVRSWIGDFLVRVRAWYRRPEFVCADCERREQCVLRSSDECLIKVEQIGRYAHSHWTRGAQRRWDPLAPWDVVN